MITEIQKTQAIRLIDIFFLGPYAIWYGSTSKGFTEFQRFLMIVSGIGTILYNYSNYAKQELQTQTLQPLP